MPKRLVISDAEQSLGSRKPLLRFNLKWLSATNNVTLQKHHYQADRIIGVVLNGWQHTSLQPPVYTEVALKSLTICAGFELANAG